jgi:integrase
MASVVKDPKGKKRLLFKAHDGKRKPIRLGKMSLRDAETIKGRVEALLASKLSGCPWDGELARWVAEIPDGLAGKLAKFDLIPKRASTTLGPFLDAYIGKRVDVKPATKRKCVSTRVSLVTFFGGDKPLHEITPGCADEWRLDMVQRKLAENTIRKHTAVAKLFFGAAVNKRLIATNPFSHLKATILPNPQRFYFVTREETQKVIDACPDAQWRLIVALSRYGGLRCPSETLSLTWRDIDWGKHGRIRVRSPKTEHHAGGESRVIPLFPELRPYLEAVFEEAQPGSEYVITAYRDTNQNLRSRLLDIIWAAGLKEWPKLFQNMRSTRETELAESFPMHVVCQWIGNSEPVAAKHYLQVTDEHFRLATGGPPKAAQKAAQYAHEMNRKAPHRVAKTPCFPDPHGPLRYCTNVELAEAGLEPAREFLPEDFKSSASAYSATRPGSVYAVLVARMTGRRQGCLQRCICQRVPLLALGQAV